MMEKYTFSDKDGLCIDGANGKAWSDMRGRFYGKAIDRLAAYEDTGLEPEEVEAAKKIAEWFTSLFNDMVPRNKEGDSMLVEKPTGTIRTAYDSNNDPYLFEATGAEAKRFMDILNADDDGRLLVLPCKMGGTVWFNTYKNNATECVGIQPHEVKRVEEERKT